MTQTLTTDELRQIVDSHEKGYGMSVPVNYGYLAARELLANREAQPVAIVESSAYVTAAQIIGDEPPMKAVKELYEGALDIGQQLYTAPPAPAVPDGYCIMPLTLTAANGAKCALSGEFKVSRTVRCHECGGEGCDDCADAGEFEEEITVPWDTIKDIYRAAVDTCRAAMLAQPVSQGYKLVPVEPTEEMIAAAMNCDDVEFNSDETFCVNFDNIYRAMLAATPEGSNG